jgi:hypothetical protein
VRTFKIRYLRITRRHLDMKIRHIYRNRAHSDMDMTDLATKMRDLGSKIQHIHIAIWNSELKIRDLASKIRDSKVKMRDIAPKTVNSSVKFVVREDKNSSGRFSRLENVLGYWFRQCAETPCIFDFPSRQYKIWLRTLELGAHC